MQQYNLGDVLKIQLGGGIRHYGIYAGEDRVIHNSKKLKKVEESGVEQFSDGHPISLSNGIKTDNPALAIQTARKYIGLPYNLFSENCAWNWSTTKV